MYMPVTGYAGRAVLFNISVTLSGIQGWLRTARQTRSPQAGRLNRTECPLCAVSSTDGCNTKRVTDFRVLNRDIPVSQKFTDNKLAYIISCKGFTYWMCVRKVINTFYWLSPILT